jgi:hypothetical protein
VWYCKQTFQEVNQRAFIDLCLESLFKTFGGLQFVAKIVCSGDLVGSLQLEEKPSLSHYVLRPCQTDLHQLFEQRSPD